MGAGRMFFSPVDEMKRVFLKISGQVQGVFFRVFVRDKAQRLSLVGWVCNAADGTVQVLAQGIEDNLKKLIKYCQDGPKFAKVDKVEVRWEEANGEFGNFEIKHNCIDL